MLDSNAKDSGSNPAAGFDFLFKGASYNSPSGDGQMMSITTEQWLEASRAPKKALGANVLGYGSAFNNFFF